MRTAGGMLSYASEGAVPFGSSYIVKTIRLLAWELAVIDAACEALGGVERAP